MQRKLSSLDLVFVTCGQSSEDAQKVLDNHFGGTLSKLGKHQAAQLAGVLKYADFGTVICSPCTKALETGSILFPQKKLMSLSLVGPFKFGCLATKPRSAMFESLLASDVPEREFKVKGADNLEILRSRVKEFFKRLACALLWGKEDNLLNSSRKGNKILVITHEIFVLEMLEYIKDREEKIRQIKEGRQTHPTETDENSNDNIEEKNSVMIDVSPRDLQQYTQLGRLPFEPASMIKKTKVLSVEGDFSPKRAAQKDSLFNDQSFRAKVIQRSVPAQYLSKNACTVTKIRVTCPRQDFCCQMARDDLSDDYLDYVIDLERDTSHLR